MDDIRREDRRLFWKAVLTPSRWIPSVGLILVGGLIIRSSMGAFMASVSQIPLYIGIGLAALGVGSWYQSARREAIANRFKNPRHRMLWQAAEDRMAQFDSSLRKLRSDRVADLRDLAANLHATSIALYAALRRADLLLEEIQGSEAVVQRRPPPIPAQSNDPQAQELYRIADRNIAEYRQHLAGVMAGVQRTEAQAAVFSTTLDTLRVRMLGHRIVGRSPEIHQHDFLAALSEAKMQLSAIDRALEEIELTPFPKSIVILPPVPGSEVHMQQDA
ncbi:MAG: hypothetical protein HONBIEJF_01181 [Fimbriimonadaceae bacterium]|nr:hypothetical protein [Fimbriimonadaceae bacterium]